MGLDIEAPPNRVSVLWGCYRIGESHRVAESNALGYPVGRPPVLTDHFPMGQQVADPVGYLGSLSRC